MEKEGGQQALKRAGTGRRGFFAISGPGRGGDGKAWFFDPFWGSQRRGVFLYEFYVYQGGQPGTRKGELPADGPCAGRGYGADGAVPSDAYHPCPGRGRGGRGERAAAGTGLPGCGRAGNQCAGDYAGGFFCRLRAFIYFGPGPSGHRPVPFRMEGQRKPDREGNPGCNGPGIRHQGRGRGRLHRAQHLPGLL